MSDDAKLLEDPLTWGEVTNYIESLIDQCRRRREIPLTEAFVFRRGQLAAVLELPGFVVEESGRILHRLREVVPQTAPDQILIVMAWASVENGRVTLGLRDLRWTRGCGWRGQLHIYEEAGVRIAVVEPLDLDDLVHVQIAAMFDAAVPTGLIDLRSLEDDEKFLVHPEGAFAHLGLVAASSAHSNAGFDAS